MVPATLLVTVGEPTYLDSKQQGAASLAGHQLLWVVWALEDECICSL